MKILKLKSSIVRFVIFFLILSFIFNPSITYSLISLKEEVEIGKEVLRELSSQVKFIEDIELVAYVNSIGQTLKTRGVDFSPFDYHFFLIKDNTFNAFSVPGGYIFINSGVFESINSEDELAGIIAHEMAHNLCRHIARRIETIKRMQVLTTATILAAILLGNPKVINAVGISSIALAQTKLLAYSRADEEEADRTGFQILSRAGYNPWGMVNIMQRLARQSNFAIELNYRYLLTHPLPQERLNYLILLAQKYTSNKTPVNLICPDKVYFKRLCIKATVLSTDPESLVPTYKEELATKENPWTRYALALALGEERFFKEAFKEMQKALAKLPKKPYFLLDLAELYFRAGDYTSALKIINNIKIPNPPKYGYQKIYSLKLKYLKGRILAETGDPYSAYKMFKDLESNPVLETDPYFYFYFGRICSQLGKVGEAHFYFAKHYEFRGDYFAAIYHYKKALSFLPKTDKMYIEAKSDLKKLNKSLKNVNPEGGSNYRRSN